MDRNRVIDLVEVEIQRKKMLAEICDKEFAKVHLEVAEALKEVLNVYQKSKGSYICMTGEKNWRLM